jgi:REP element-mobilizing transposase RayT
MDLLESLSHTQWNRKCPVVRVQKYRHRVLRRLQRSHLGEVFHRLTRQKESRIEEGVHLMSDSVQMLISIPPSIVCARRSATSRAKARSICRTSTASGRATFRCSSFGSVVLCVDHWTGVRRFIAGTRVKHAMPPKPIFRASVVVEQRRWSSYTVSDKTASPRHVRRHSPELRSWCDHSSSDHRERCFRRADLFSSP